MLKIFILTLLALFACVTSQEIFANCEEAIAAKGRNEVYEIEVNGAYNITNNVTMMVYCEADKKGGDPWTIVQRRKDGSINFKRNWYDYRVGFGNIYGEFFIGLDNLHALTQSAVHELWMRFEAWDNTAADAYYDSFAIGNKDEYYDLYVLGQYSGDARDGMRYHEGMKFSTFDFDNDVHDKIHCAKKFHGGWWYNSCVHGNLNGLYLKATVPKSQMAEGVCWIGFKDFYYSMKYVHMAIRPVK